jgi:WhiB family redox-sensing transcriptional regulator
MAEHLTNAAQGWVEHAHCRITRINPDYFFPERGGSAQKQAEKLCAPCTVKDECLRFALDNNEWMGIWGGKSGRQRRKIKQLEAKGIDWR